MLKDFSQSFTKDYLCPTLLIFGAKVSHSTCQINGITLEKGKRNEIHTNKKLALREFCAEPDNIQTIKLLSDPKKRKSNGN